MTRILKLVWIIYTSIYAAVYESENQNSFSNHTLHEKVSQEVISVKYENYTGCCRLIQNQQGMQL